MKEKRKKAVREQKSWSEPVRPFTELGRKQQDVDEELAKQGYDDDSGFSGVPQNHDEKAKDAGRKIA